MGKANDNQQRPLELEYAPAAPFFRHRWFVRALIYTAIIVAVIALRKPASRFIANWNLNRLVAASVNRTDPPGTVVYRIKLDDESGKKQSQFIRRIASWDNAQAAQLFAWRGLRHRAAATLFVGRSPPRFAHNSEVFGMDLQFSHSSKDDRHCSVAVEFLAGRRSDRGEWSIGQQWQMPFMILSGDWRDLVVECAQVDPTDANHLTFDMIVDERRHTFDVWLSGNAIPRIVARTREPSFYYFNTVTQKLETGN